MSLMAPIVDGQLQTSTTSSESLKNSSNKSTVDSDTFLTLLVAQMQNQDPLEPTSNTEWVAQYATFTQVEQMTEMGESMDLLRANSLIGKEVVMKVTSESTGETSYKRGVVDYVTVEEGKAFLVIDEEKYAMSDLDSVASEEYFEAYDLYTQFTGMLDALPSLKLIDKSYENTVGKVYELYNSLTEYQKDYIDKYASGYVESYKAYIDKMEQLGITFGEEAEEEDKLTLDDVLEAFNKKMDELMEKIGALNGGNQDNDQITPPDETEDGGTVDETTPPDETEDGGTVDETTPPDETEDGGTVDETTPPDETEDGGTVDETTSPDETEDGTVDEGQPSDETENGGEAESSDTTDDILNQLTQDTEKV